MMMNSTLAYVQGRRTWFVENMIVWGTDSDAEFLLAIAETAGSDTRVGFLQVSLGGQRQAVNFSSLTDSRGNRLPDQIKKPSVVIIPRDRRGAFLKSVLGETGFVVAKMEADSPSATVDLLIVETGL
jgi:hypothetical protein